MVCDRELSWTVADEIARLLGVELRARGWKFLSVDDLDHDRKVTAGLWDLLVPIGDRAVYKLREYIYICVYAKRIDGRYASQSC